MLRGAKPKPWLSDVASRGRARLVQGQTVGYRRAVKEEEPEVQPQVLVPLGPGDSAETGAVSASRGQDRRLQPHQTPGSWRTVGAALGHMPQ